MKRFVIVGAGGHARVVRDAIELSGDHVIGLLDDNSALWGNSLQGVPIQGPIAKISMMDFDGACVAIGDNRARRQVFHRLQADNVPLPNVIHPRAVIAPDVELTGGIVVFANVVVNTGTHIGENVILNTACTVDHDCVIGAHVHLAPGTHLAGGVEIGEGALVGIGSVVIPNLRLGEWAVVGAGSTVVRNVPDGATVAGVPARVIRREARS